MIVSKEVTTSPANRDPILPVVAQFNGIVNIDQPDRLAPSDPAANAYTFVIRDNEHLYRITSIRFKFTADATVMDRLPLARYCDANARFIYDVLSPVVRPASGAATLNACIGASSGSTTSVNNTASLPDIWLRNGDYILITAFNVQAGDLLSEIFFTYETICKRRY